MKLISVTAVSSGWSFTVGGSLVSCTVRVNCMLVDSPCLSSAVRSTDNTGVVSWSYTIAARRSAMQWTTWMYSEMSRVGDKSVTQTLWSTEFMNCPRRLISIIHIKNVLLIVLRASKNSENYAKVQYAIENVLGIVYEINCKSKIFKSWIFLTFPEGIHCWLTKLIFILVDLIETTSLVS